METYELTTPYSFELLLQAWRGDKESLVQALVDRKVNCYVPVSVDPETEAGLYKKLEMVTPKHFKSIRFDSDDIHLMFLAETIEARAKNNEKSSVHQMKEVLQRKPSVDEWRKSVATSVKIIGHYLEYGHEWPMEKNHRDEWKDLIARWNEEAGSEAYRLHDKAREELWRAANSVKAVTNKTWRKEPPKK